MLKLICFVILMVAEYVNAASNITSTVPASLFVPGSCSISGVPGNISVTLSDTTTVSTSFSFSVSCNFTGTANLSFSSSCMQGSSPCIATSNNLNFVTYAVTFNSQSVAPLQQLSVNSVGTVLVNLTFAKAVAVGTYTATDTLTLNY